ncbi:MAG: site-specific integrase [Deltaproteobacteria bacterium]
MYRRNDSEIWWISFQVNGRRVRESAGTSSKMKAKALLAKREAAAFEGTFFPEKKKRGFTVGQLRDRWLEHAKRKKSLAADRTRFELLVELLGEHTPIANLEGRHVEQLIEDLAETPTRLGRPMAPATVNRHLALLRAALNLAKRDGYQHRDPMAGARVLAEHNERDRVASAEEYRALVDASAGDLQLAIVLGYETGMRLGEIVSLQWKQVDLRRRIVTLASGSTKTGEGRRVPLSAGAVDALEAHPRRIDGRVFGVKRGTISPAFASLTRELGIEDLRFHDFRHTALTNLRRGGADIFTIAAISGHKDLQTLKRYQTITDDDLHAAVEKARP